jgi:hypothetical protein
MDQDERLLSAEGHRSRAARLRKLAADMTTPRAKEHLLALARESEAVGSGRSIVAGPAAGDERYGLLRPRVRR